VLGLGLGLLSSLAYGISDFLGGLQSRRVSALTVLLVTQPVGLLLALTVALAAGGDPLSRQDALVAIGGGIAAVLALAAFYRAMALGSVSVVATIGALGVLVPVAYGLAQGEEPHAIQAAGAALAIVGVVLVAREPDPEWRSANRVTVGLAALAALGFGLLFTSLDIASGAQPAWTVVAARAGGVVTLLIGGAFIRPSMRIEHDMYPALAAIGVCDVSANSLFALATNHGLLSLVAVAGSLYSAVTVFLARIVLGERLGSWQRNGVVLALAGVAMIAAGS
jgi:drug/metabolite transporter (DMT)-like permease